MNLNVYIEEEVCSQNLFIFNFNATAICATQIELKKLIKYTIAYCSKKDFSQKNI